MTKVCTMTAYKAGLDARGAGEDIAANPYHVMDTRMREAWAMGWSDGRRKSDAQLAYEEDVRRRPFYNDGSPRCDWHSLDDLRRSTWIKNPTPREFKHN